MKRYDCSKTVDYFKVKGIMCERHGLFCSGCPLSAENNGEGMHCEHLEVQFPYAAPGIAQKWADEHLQKEEE